jgi:hypothetical protein
VAFIIGDISAQSLHKWVAFNPCPTSVYDAMLPRLNKRDIEPEMMLFPRINRKNRMTIDTLGVVMVLIPSSAVCEKSNTLWHSVHKEPTVIGELV